MERIAAVLEREQELLDVLLFKLVETRLILESGELRFLARATREVERARARPGRSTWCGPPPSPSSSPGPPSASLAAKRLRAVAGHPPRPPRPAGLPGGRDRGDRPPQRRRGPRRARGLTREKVPAVAAGTADGDAELDRLAQGASLETVLATASRLRMPDLLDFLR